ncbi:MAG: hypothetical protein GX945_05830 [Lentisphaerae bacterium]|nr:hypothetical protein [Lentisphaerota bacterium]
MARQDMFTDSGHDNTLQTHVPFIWPEARFHTGQGRYGSMPPSAQLIAKADLINAVIVGAAEDTISWLTEMLHDGKSRRLCLILVLYPASPTREKHLKAIHELQTAAEAGKTRLDVRLFLMDRNYGEDCIRVSLPPTVIQAHCSSTGETTMSIGAVGDLGHDQLFYGSFNLVFQPDDALRDVWRRWFQFVHSISVPLNEETLHIPHLVPAEGQPEAARMWEDFKSTCRDAMALHDATALKVNAETGEIESDIEGKPVVPWDDGMTALDPLGRILQKVYADGWLVTVDEATRIKPLSIPVKAQLLGQDSERTVGTVRQKQSFSLQVLDDDIDKAIEKCRKVTELINLLTFPLSQGNCWLPKAAYPLLEKELNARNEEGLRLLCGALGQKRETTGDYGGVHEQKPGDGISKKDLIQRFIAARRDKFTEDLNEMYRELGQSGDVPADRLQSIMDEIANRLEQALTVRIAPNVVRNPISAPDLTSTAPDENWNQPLSLLRCAAETFRKALTDSYFRRKFTGLAFSENEYLEAYDVFGDYIRLNQNRRQAERERCQAERDLAILSEIIADKTTVKEKCHSVWSIIKGKHLEHE